jgi:hypothetical protein
MDLVIELALLLGLFHVLQRLISGVFVGESGDQHANACHGFGLSLFGLGFRGFLFLALYRWK